MGGPARVAELAKDRAKGGRSKVKEKKPPRVFHFRVGCWLTVTIMIISLLLTSTNGFHFTSVSIFIN